MGRIVDPDVAALGDTEDASQASAALGATETEDASQASAALGATDTEDASQASAALGATDTEDAEPPEPSEADLEPAARRSESDAGFRLPPMPTPPPPPITPSSAPASARARTLTTPPPPSTGTQDPSTSTATPLPRATRTQDTSARPSTSTATPLPRSSPTQDTSARPSTSRQAVPARRSSNTADAPAGPEDPPAGVDSSAPDDEAAAPPRATRTGHPVRDRLLAKAAAARASERERDQQAEAVYPKFSSLKGVEDDLDELAAPPARQRIDSVSLAGSVLSPLQLSVVGTLLAVALLAALFALLIQFVPHGETPSLLVSKPTTTSSSAAALALPVPAPSATAPKPPAPEPREPVAGPWRITDAKTGQKLIRGQIGREPFLRAIQQAGLDKTQAYRVYAALKDETNLDRCHPKNEFAVLVERSSGRVEAFEYIVSKEEVYQAKQNSDGQLEGERLDLKVERRRVQASLMMGSEGFAAAARHAGLDPSVGRVINKALDGHTRISQFHEGDRLRIVAQEVTVLGEFYRYAGIEALEYVPLTGAPLRIYYYSRKKRYYDAKGRSPGEGGWRTPVRGAPITSRFNPKRLHPILKKRMPHNGTDYGAPTGTPVRAASYGKITKLGNYGANGNFIAIEHPGGYETGYSHLSRFEPGLKVGEQVSRQQVIGYVGSTGRSTGPHLHFSAKKNGGFIDPESLNLDALVVLPSGERADFNRVKEHYDEMLSAVALPEPIATADTQLVAAAAPPAPSAAPEAAPQAARPAAQAPAADPPAPAKLAQAQLPVQPARTAAAPARKHQALYLTDKELIELQSAVDDGEVDE